MVPVAGAGPGPSQEPELHLGHPYGQPALGPTRAAFPGAVTGSSTGSKPAWI